MENETLSINRKEYEALLFSVGKLQRKFELVAKTLFTQADNLRPKAETAHAAPTVDFGGLCYLSAYAELGSIYKDMSELRSNALVDPT